MIASITLVLLVVLSGTIATYFYDDSSPLSARICAGACLGLTALSLIGFVFAMVLGLTSVTILLAVLICSLPVLLLVRATYLERLQADLRRASKTIGRFMATPDLVMTGYVVFYGITFLVLWRVFSRAMIQDVDGISTGL